jgi:hypothetical protein
MVDPAGQRVEFVSIPQRSNTGSTGSSHCASIDLIDYGNMKDQKSRTKQGQRFRNLRRLKQRRGRYHVLSRSEAKLTGLILRKNKALSSENTRFWTKNSELTGDLVWPIPGPLFGL